VDKRFKFEFQPDDTKSVPCVVPRYFLDMYNLAYSESMGLPKVNENFAIGKHVKLYLGESYTMGDAKAKKKEVTLQIVGLTPNPNFVGVLIPLQNALAWNEWYTGRENKNYTALHVKLKDVNSLSDVIRSIEKMEFSVESQKETFEKFQFVARALGILTALFGIIVALISAISIFNTFSLIMAQRRGEVGLLRAVGASRRTVSTIYLVEVLAIGFVGGALGIAASGIILRIAEREIVARLPKVTFLPDHLFNLSAPVMFACLAGGLLLSLVATLPIILRTTHTPPVNLITE
jgi:putative ABC transport system permease protein